MHSKNLTKEELAHMGRVKELPCSVCGAAGPSEAHHIKQGKHFLTVSLCQDCHRGPVMGWHGQKRMWSILKMDELDALNNTVRMLSRCA